MPLTPYVPPTALPSDSARRSESIGRASPILTALVLLGCIGLTGAAIHHWANRRGTVDRAKFQRVLWASRALEPARGEDLFGDERTFRFRVSDLGAKYDSVAGMAANPREALVLERWRASAIAFHDALAMSAFDGRENLFPAEDTTAMLIAFEGNGSSHLENIALAKAHGLATHVTHRAYPGYGEVTNYWIACADWRALLQKAHADRRAAEALVVEE